MHPPISAFDMKHNFVASYQLNVPFDQLFHHKNQLTDGWSHSGTTRFSTGLPVTLYDDSDYSLLGTLGNGINNYLLDTPNTKAARSTSTPIHATGNLSSIPWHSTRKSWGSWEMPADASSTARESTISI
jgi:hypothetical protein